MGPGIAINTNRLRCNENEIRRLMRELQRIETALQNIRRTLDWDVRNERGIEQKFHEVCSEVDNEEGDLTRSANFLADAIRSYQEADDLNRRFTSLLFAPNTPQNMVCTPPQQSYPFLAPGYMGNSNPFVNQWIGFQNNPWLPYSNQGQGVYTPLWVYPQNILTPRDYFATHGVTLNNTPSNSSGKDDNVTGDLLGYEFKPQASANWDFEKRQVGAGASVGIEGYVAKGEVKGQSGVFSGTLQGSALTGSAKAEAQATLFTNGEFDPNLTLGASAEAKGLTGSAEGQVGNEDYNVHGKAEGSVGYAKAEASATLGLEGVGAHVGADAAVFQGEVKTGFTLFGINIDLSAEGEALSVGAEADFGINKDEIEVGGKLSFLAGLGAKLKISW